MNSKGTFRRRAFCEVPWKVNCNNAWFRLRDSRTVIIINVKKQGPAKTWKTESWTGQSMRVWLSKSRYVKGKWKLDGLLKPDGSFVFPIPQNWCLSLNVTEYSLHAESLDKIDINGTLKCERQILIFVGSGRLMIHSFYFNRSCEPIKIML